MSIKPKTRKILWGRSGNRCALCRRELVIERSANDADAIVGDECHIISKRDNGPRSYKIYPIQLDLDSYDNLLLLCKTHHKLVDDQPKKYDVRALRHLKSNHENWVRDSLISNEKQTSEKTEFQGVTLLPRITSGKVLVNIVKGAHLYRFDNDELETSDEMEIVSNFSQSLQDYGDVLSDLDIGETIRAGFDLTQDLRELEKMGFLVFGERKVEHLKVGGILDDWHVATVCILREGNPTIVDLANLETE